MLNINQSKEILEICGANIEKCMSCGRCSAACPSHEGMDLRPHQFVSLLKNGENSSIETMLSSDSLWHCLSCFCCSERCPRGVKPAHIIEAVRLVVIRKQGVNGLSPDDITELMDEQMPQQLLVSAFRKYKR